MGSIYCILEDLFGIHLANYLWGYECATNAFNNPNLFNIIGVIAIVITLIFTLIYYYAIRHPRFTGWGSWLIVMAVVGLINFSIGYAWTNNDLLNGKIGSCLVHQLNQNGDVISTQISSINCLMFGFVNLLVSIILFVIFSFALKWWSKHAKYSPI